MLNIFVRMPHLECTIYIQIFIFAQLKTLDDYRTFTHSIHFRCARRLIRFSFKHDDAGAMRKQSFTVEASQIRMHIYSIYSMRMQICQHRARGDAVNYVRIGCDGAAVVSPLKVVLSCCSSPSIMLYIYCGGLSRMRI